MKLGNSVQTDTVTAIAKSQLSVFIVVGGIRFVMINNIYGY